MAKYLYFLLINCFLLVLSSCNDTDDTSVKILQYEDSLEQWPLKQGNQWLYYKDTLVDTLRIDTSLVINNIEHFKNTGFKNIFLPNYFNKDSIITYLTNRDSVLFVNIPAASFVENNLYIERSEISLPLFKKALDVNTNYTGITTFSTVENGISEVITLDYDVKVIDKNSTEAIGGRVFQNLIKIENIYSFSSSLSAENFTLSIWLQPGVGPVKIVKSNQESTHLLKSYQIIQ